MREILFSVITTGKVAFALIEGIFSISADSELINLNNSDPAGGISQSLEYALKQQFALNKLSNNGAVIGEGQPFSNEISI
ncbi:hypothetical protein GCM10007941_27170 [Amphritea balenae]|nr:hypothetical protein GCM10007941_27170 [Amphritea balenae]